MPKKRKVVQDENQPEIANGASALAGKIDKKPAGRRSTRTKKSSLVAKKKTGKTKAVKASKPVPAIEPSDEDVRIRAYFIAERRSRLALPGDSNTDWLEAKRQLLSEFGRH